MVMVLTEGFGALWCFLFLVRSWKPDPKYLEGEEWDELIWGIIVCEEKKKVVSWNRSSVTS